MRSAQTIARGIIIAMKTPIITAMRIWSRYCRNAVSDADLDLARVDAVAAEPEHGGRGERSG